MTGRKKGNIRAWQKPVYHKKHHYKFIQVKK